MHYIGVDVGGMSIKGCLVTKKGKIVARFTLPTNVYDKNYSISEDIRKVIEGTMKAGDRSQTRNRRNGVGESGADAPGSGVCT